MFGPDDENILTGSDDSRAILWDAVTASILQDFRGHTGTVWSAAMSADRRLAATGSQDSTARVWDASTGMPVAVLEGHTAAVRAVAFVGDGSHLVTGSEDKTLILWDARAGAVLDRLYLDSRVSCIAAVDNHVFAGDYGGGLYFLNIDC